MSIRNPSATTGRLERDIPYAACMLSATEHNIVPVATNRLFASQWASGLIVKIA